MTADASAQLTVLNGPAAVAEAAGLTIHVRLIEGENSQHVMSAIFKALGIALARATRGDD